MRITATNCFYSFIVGRVHSKKGLTVLTSNQASNMVLISSIADYSWKEAMRLLRHCQNYMAESTTGDFFVGMQGFVWGATYENVRVSITGGSYSDGYRPQYASVRIIFTKDKTGGACDFVFTNIARNGEYFRTFSLLTYYDRQTSTEHGDGKDPIGPAVDVSEDGKVSHSFE